jgi:isopenicillin N synthase-like dioxygenase
MSIPIVNFEPWLNGTGKDAVAKELFDACSRVGFVMLRGFESLVPDVEEAFEKVRTGLRIRCTSAG